MDVYFGEGVFSEISVEDGIGDLVIDFVGVVFINGFGSEKEVVLS